MTSMQDIAREPEKNTGGDIGAEDFTMWMRKAKDESEHDAGECSGVESCTACVALVASENRRLISANKLLILDLQRNIKAAEKQAKTLLPAWKLLCLMIISVATLQIIGDLAQLLPN
jgi:hypothetical protein